jgi:hypothetical protein
MAVGKTYLTGSDGLFRVYDHATDAWSDYTGFTTEDLFDVKTDTANPNYAIICGLNYFAYTADAGVTVTEVTPPLGAVARAFQISIPALVNQVVYICGSGGGSQAGLIKSVDGGITYTSEITGLSPSYGNQGLSLYFKDVNVGVLAHGEAIAKTTNGAANWTYLNSGNAIAVGETVSGVHISANEQIIIAVTDAGIYRSTNAGVSFTSVYAYVDPDYNGAPLKYCHLSWYDDNNMWVSGANGPILYTSNAGLTWLEVFPGQLIGDDGRSIFGSHFYSLTEGFFTYDKGAESLGLVYKAINADAAIVATSSTDYFATGSVGYAVWTLVTSNIYCGCPDGYLYNPGSGECEQTATIDAVYSGDLLTVNYGDTSIAYGKYGARLYEDITNKTFPIVRSTPSPTNLVDNNGAGSIISIYNGIAAYGSIRNTLWGYDSSGAIPACGTGNIGGRLNTVGIGVLPSPEKPDYLCFEYCVNINTTKQYLVAFAADNYGKLYLDNVELINLDTPDTKNFFYWHIFPITLTSGDHTLKICGSNFGVVTAFAFGAEIYNISAADFVFNNFLSKPALNSADCGNIPTDLTNGVNSNGEPILIFSTGDYIGQQVADPSGTGEWTCPPGWELDICFGIPSCTKILTAEYNPCCYDLINCADGTTYATVNTNSSESDILAEYVGSIIVFEGLPECLFVTVTGECNNATSIENLNITDTFTTCQECQEAIEINPCYKLTNCNNGDVFIMTQQNLSQVAGLVVELAEYPGLCWTVLETYNCVGEFTTVSIVQSYPDCECCFQYQCV